MCGQQNVARIAISVYCITKCGKDDILRVLDYKMS